ncbi:MAG: hypothetical protein HKN81_06245 [Gammaproteobacteria bacterium]|nr:hypothetical protein [Gammaproteobacteria bacterium]
MQYIQLIPATLPPDVSALSPFKAVVIVEDAATPERRAVISKWLVESGCLYMMARGRDSDAWQDAVQAANLAAFDLDEIPDDRLIIATSHGDEPLDEVFWFAKYTAMHPCHTLETVLVLDLSATGREREICAAYEAA